MLYHVIRRPLHPSSNDSSNQRSTSVPPPKLMPRYHYSRIVPNSATTHLVESASKPKMTTTTSNNHHIHPYESFKSTFIPLVTSNRPTMPNKREFIQIPIMREDGSPMTTNNPGRSVPITYLSETAALPSATNNNETPNPRPMLTNLVRPSSKYFQPHFNNTNEDPIVSSVPRLPSVSRRLSLTIPVMMPGHDDVATKQPIPSSPSFRLPQAAVIASTTPTNSSRISSAILRPSPVSNMLQRQKTDIGDVSLSSPTLLTTNNPQQSSFDFGVTSSNTSSIQRAEVKAREAIQGMTRLQQQQRNGSISEPPKDQSPSSSRRVIINLKNNQCVSLDSRLSSAMKPPVIPSSSRIIQRNNLYHIPILCEIQTPLHSATAAAEVSSPSPINNGNYKNEFHMEIPVTISNSHDQENALQQRLDKVKGIIHRERLPSINLHPSNSSLKSILKSSSSRETVLRKNVSFMNA